MKCDVYLPFRPPHPTMFPITLLLSTYVFFLFDNVLSSVRAGLMCMGMGPSEYGKPTSSDTFNKERFSLPSTSIANSSSVFGWGLEMTSSF